MGTSCCWASMLAGWEVASLELAYTGARLKWSSAQVELASIPKLLWNSHHAFGFSAKYLVSFLWWSSPHGDHLQAPNLRFGENNYIL
ncbi:hypothetical protein VNO80_01211 [Phaseolus coccineus]|uniref:Uncharacterized protein n=1 Tax=Phaseolus coccineus TaxID=3886 RepID=A0AAN9P0W5_PHACN